MHSYYPAEHSKCLTTDTAEEVGTVDVGMDRMMSEATCNAVFPALYKELDRSVAFYNKRGHIQKADLGAHQRYVLGPTDADP